MPENKNKKDLTSEGMEKVSGGGMPKEVYEATHYPDGRPKEEIAKSWGVYDLYYYPDGSPREKSQPKRPIDSVISAEDGDKKVNNN